MINGVLEFSLSYEQIVFALQQLQKEHFSIAFDIPPEDPFAGVASEILSLASLYAKRMTQWQQINALSTEISKGVLLEDVLNRTYHTLHTIIPYSRLGCAMFTDDETELQLVWARAENMGNMRLIQGYKASIAQSSLQQILASGEPRIINDLVAHLKSHPQSDATQRIVQEGIRSSLTCPLIVEGKPVGFLFFSSKQKNTYQDVHLDMFKRIALLISIFIDKSRLYQDIHNLNQALLSTQEDLLQKSMYDSLTGLYNRGAILDLLRNAIHKAQRCQTRLGIMMIDVDYFKKVNDTYGHQAGDEVLRRVALAIKSAVREYDELGRYGGEEFLLLLADPTDELIDAIAARIHEQVGAASFAEGAGPARLAVSIGIAVAGPQALTVDALIAQADGALYRAKEAGRGRSMRSGG